MCRRGVCYATVCGAEMSWRVLFWHNVEPNLLKNSREHSAAAVREFFAVHIGGAPLESGHHFESQTIQRIQNVFGRTLSALASIWRMRSRVTENWRPTSCSVWSLFMPMPKRMRIMLCKFSSSR